jgi:hypothetical protein
MSNVIRFLENLGQEAAYRHATQDELTLALSNAQIDPQLHAAILGRDQQQLEAILGSKTNVCCALMPGKEKDDEEEAPSKDDDEITARTVRHGVASAA